MLFRGINVVSIPVPDLTTVVLDTADCDAACLALQARGVDCDDPVVFPGFVTYCTFRDPFGNTLQMCGPPRH